MNASTTLPASEAQIKYAGDLVRTKQVSPEQLIAFGRIQYTSRADASLLIDALKACPPKAADPAKPVPVLTELGVFIGADGRIYKTQPNKDTGKYYVKRWYEVAGQRATSQCDCTILHAPGNRHDFNQAVCQPGFSVPIKGDWEYVWQQQRAWTEQVVNGRKMNLQEAKAFILRYGKCCRCGRRLKARESVERGIGPVCVTYFSF